MGKARSTDRPVRYHRVRLIPLTPNEGAILSYLVRYGRKVPSEKAQEAVALLTTDEAKAVAKAILDEKAAVDPAYRKIANEYRLWAEENRRYATSIRSPRRQLRTAAATVS